MKKLSFRSSYELIFVYRTDNVLVSCRVFWHQQIVSVALEFYCFVNNEALLSRSTGLQLCTYRTHCTGVRVLRFVKYPFY